MTRRRRTVLRSLAVCAAAAIAVVGLTGATTTANAQAVSGSNITASSHQGPTPESRPCHARHRGDCKVAPNSLFDDFHYASPRDPVLTRHGWVVRSDSGGPGVEGATWSPDNISFPRVNGHKSLQLQLTTDGTAAGTTQSEFSQAKYAVREGTYLARIKFSDAPVRGPDGDYLNETFFAISQAASDCDPTYSETDFSEYLPNGGWGTTHHLNSETTWYTPGENCSDSVENDQDVSMAGWHTVMATVSAGHVRYYVDGNLVADHSGKYYPRADMAIDFNMWLIDVTGHSGHKSSVWHEAVDYVYYAKGQVLTQKQVEYRVRILRRHHVDYLNSMQTH
jgi:hypothetical protein